LPKKRKKKRQEKQQARRANEKTNLRKKPSPSYNDRTLRFSETLRKR